VTPGTIQFAKSPFSLTYIPPKIVMSRWPPQIIAKEVLESIQAAPSFRNTVSQEAFMIS